MTARLRIAAPYLPRASEYVSHRISSHHVGFRVAPRSDFGFGNHQRIYLHSRSAGRSRSLVLKAYPPIPTYVPDPKLHQPYLGRTVDAPFSNSPSY